MTKSSFTKKIISANPYSTGFAEMKTVPLTGLEPVRILLRGILSPLCLPISPQRHKLWKYYTLFLSVCQEILMKKLRIGNFYK